MCIYSSRPVLGLGKLAATDLTLLASAARHVSRDVSDLDRRPRFAAAAKRERDPSPVAEACVWLIDLPPRTLVPW
jgi:hypothetical protein